MELVRSGIVPGLWDYLWLYTYWKNDWLSIVPNQNLVTNIGFDEEATHTKRIPEWQYPNMHTEQFDTQVSTRSVKQDFNADKWAARHIHNSSPDIVVKTWLVKKLRVFIRILKSAK